MKGIFALFKDLEHEQGIANRDGLREGSEDEVEGSLEGYEVEGSLDENDTEFIKSILFNFYLNN